jgi:N-formylglutamate deformylase
MPRMEPNEIVISIPHGGTDIPADLRRLIPHDSHTLCNESDLYTERLYALEDARTVSTLYSRIISDPNRAPDEIYTDGRLRALGVVMLSLPEGHDVFEEDPPMEVLHSWVQRFHSPFHEALTKAACGASFLFDCHSMWSRAAPGHYGAEGEARADIVLGNQYFCTCSAETTQFFSRFFEGRGYSVSINNPYPGRYILGTYCSRLSLPGIQIEINRKLYMNEETLDPREADIAKFNGEFRELVGEFCEWFTGAAPPEEKPMTDLSE